MDSRQIDLALRKQKLQMQAAAQRTDMTRRLAGIDGTLDRLDSVRDNLAVAAPRQRGERLINAFMPRAWLRREQAAGGGEIAVLDAGVELGHQGYCTWLSPAHHAGKIEHGPFNFRRND